MSVKAIRSDDSHNEIELCRAAEQVLVRYGRGLVSRALDLDFDVFVHCGRVDLKLPVAPVLSIEVIDDDGVSALATPPNGATASAAAITSAVFRAARLRNEERASS